MCKVQEVFISFKKYFAPYILLFSYKVIFLFLSKYWMFKFVKDYFMHI